MQIPEGAPTDEYKTTLIYEKEGVSREFTLEDYPADDPSWKFVDSKNELISKGYEPPIHDFTITLIETGEDITEEVLQDTNYTFLLISYQLEKASLKNAQEINKMYDYAGRNGYSFYCLNASSDPVIADYIRKTGARYPMATTDGTTLKTVVRSNPGLVLLKNGTIINKWHYRNIPVFDIPLSESDLGTVPAPTAGKNTLVASGILILPLLLIIVLDRKRRKE